MLRKKQYILMFCVTLLFLLLIFYVRRPVTVAMVADKLPNGSPWRGDIKEIEVDNLHNKMGLQLFQLQTEYGREIFLVNRFQNLAPLDSRNILGDFYCIDYDNDRRYELLYMAYDGVSSGGKLQIYSYELQGGWIHLEKTYELLGVPIAGADKALSLCEEKLYIKYDKKYPQNNISVEFRHGKWFCRGKNAKQIEIKENTEYHRDREHLVLDDLI